MDDGAAIAALIHEYAERLDGGDLDGVAALFEHAAWSSPERTRRFGARRRPAPRSPSCKARPDLPLQPILAGRYHDRFERGGDRRWRFAERMVLPDLIGDLSRHLRRTP